MSITKEASQFVLLALAARVKNGSVFTAHDVKEDARIAAAMTTEKIYHADVRNIVHQEFAVGEFPDNYNREDFLELNNGHVAICYYPDGKAATEHENAMSPTAPIIGQVPASVQQAQTANTNPVTALNQVVASATPKAKQGGSVKDGKGFICSETSKGVINIPDGIVKAVTPNAGSYDIQIEGGGLICKVADGKGRLRIASSKLGTGSKFRLEVVTNTITVVQV